MKSVNPYGVIQIKYQSVLKFYIDWSLFLQRIYLFFETEFNHVKTIYVNKAVKSHYEIMTDHINCLSNTLSTNYFCHMIIRCTM